MAPERFDGWSDPRSDVYALGATLYELLTLGPPFEDANRARLIERVLHENPVPPRKIDRRIPRDLETIVLKALAKEPAGRYATAAAMAGDLERFPDDKAILRVEAPCRNASCRWARHNKAIAASLGVIAGLLVAGLIGLGIATARFRTQAMANAALARDNEVARVNADRARDRPTRPATRPPGRDPESRDDADRYPYLGTDSSPAPGTTRAGDALVRQRRPPRQARPRPGPPQPGLRPALEPRDRAAGRRPGTRVPSGADGIPARG